MRKGSKPKYGQVLFYISLRPDLQGEGFRTNGIRIFLRWGQGEVTGTRVVCDFSRRIQPYLPS